MNPHSGNALARLAAADPARGLAIDEAARERLRQSIAQTPAGTSTAPSGARRRVRIRRLVLAIPAVLVLTAGALAATDVIHIGAPAERAGGPFSFSTVRGGGIAAGSERLLAISAPDPAGGPAWGMRVFSTKEGEGCVQVGRLLDGKLGAIGQDNAFGDDGQFHAFSKSSEFAKRACTVLDGHDRLFVNATVGDLPASAWVGYGGGCVPSTATHAERFGTHGKPLATCPQADERNVYYGLLGPDAESITYVLDGHAHTQATVGPEGAYLLVTTASPTQLLNFSAGSTQDVVPVDGPITELHYRGGATCRLTARSWMGGKDACTPELKVPVGWTPPAEAAPTAKQLVAPVHARLITTARGKHEIAVEFTAPVSATNARRAYTVRWRSPETPPKAYGSGLLEPRTPRAGQTVSADLGKGGPAWLGPGVVTGEVIFQDATGPGGLEEGPGTVEHVVGTFSVDVP
jgi:hypothetical protein